MAEDQNGTLKPDAEGSSDSVQMVERGELISTVEFAPADTEQAAEKPPGEKEEKAPETDQKGKEEETPPGKEPSGQDKGKEPTEDERLDKIPRFQELLSRTKRAEENNAVLAQEIKTLKEGRETEESVDFDDLSEMSEEEVVTLMTEKPLDFAANLARQIRHEVRAELRAEMDSTLKAKDSEGAVETSFNKWVEKHPDFDALWDAGKIQDFVAANPGHNALSAYYAIQEAAPTATDIQKAVDAAVTKAVEETTEKVRKEFTTKQHARVLPGGPAAAGGRVHETPAELKDTRKAGGLMAVLTRRSSGRTAGG